MGIRIKTDFPYFHWRPQLSSYVDPYALYCIIYPLQAPALFLFTLAIPVMDYEAPLNGWNRHLNSLHCVIAPVITMAICQKEGM